MTSNVRRRAATFALAGLALAGGLLSACTSTAATVPTTQAPATTTTIPGSQTPALTAGATLRANLTALFTSHVYLTAVATSTAVSGGDPTPAVAVINDNGSQLAAVVNSVLGGASGGGFLNTWNAQTPLLVAYAQAKARGDSAAAKAASTQLDRFGTALSSFFGSADIYITPLSLVDSDMTPYLAAVRKEIDDQAAKSTSQYDDLVAAANLMPHLADVLAAAMAKQAKIAGTVTGTASNLRSQLTAALVSHAYLEAITTATVVGHGDVAPPTATLTASTLSIANVVASVFGDAGGGQFRDLWAKHDSFFLADAAGVDPSGARASLTAMAPSVGDLLATLDHKIDSATVAGAFSGHVTTLLAVIDAQTGRSPGQFALLATAAAAMPPLATTLSEAIALTYPLMFLP